MRGEQKVAVLVGFLLRTVFLGCMKPYEACWLQNTIDRQRQLCTSASVWLIVVWQLLMLWHVQSSVVGQKVAVLVGFLLRIVFLGCLKSHEACWWLNTTDRQRQLCTSASVWLILYIAAGQSKT